MAQSSGHNYILLGPPGSGKSTQAELFRQEYGLYHCDIGAELRAVAAQPTQFGRQIHEIINVKKGLVPDKIIHTVLTSVLEHVPLAQGVLVDGAPRRLPQMDEVLEPLAEQGRVLAKVIFLDLSEAVAVERIAKRFSCSQCLTPYILGVDLENALTENCRKCGGQIVQRQDDTPEGILKRFEIFRAETMPVVQEFERQGILLRINAAQEPTAIFQDVLKGAE